MYTYLYNSIYTYEGNNLDQGGTRREKKAKHSLYFRVNLQFEILSRHPKGFTPSSTLDIFS